jgi:NDP-sugar pyrophosphorylase family protein
LSSAHFGSLQRVEYNFAKADNLLFMGNLQTVVLSAGLATGLRPLTVDRPKVLAPVCNRTLLRRTLDQLRDAGLAEATLVLRDAPNGSKISIESDVPKTFGLEIFYVPPSIDGTVPCVRAAIRADATSILVIYGDSLIKADFSGLIQQHRSRTADGCAATILYHRPADLRCENKDGRTYHGVLSANSTGRISRFVEKPKVAEIGEGFDLANAAVFLIERQMLEDTRFRQARDFSYDVFEAASGQPDFGLYGHSIGEGFRVDVGSLKRLFQVNMESLQNRTMVEIPGEEVKPGVWYGADTRCDVDHLVPPVLIGNEVRVEPGSRLGPEAIVGNGTVIGGGCVLSHCLIMEECQIGNGVRINRCMVGPHSRIGDNVVLPDGSVLGSYSIVGAL